MLKKLTIGTMAALALTFAVSNTKAADTKDIVDTAVSAGSFKTLATALTAADLVATLKGAGPFTVFAPTDEAFAMLRRILTYHVVSGKVMASDVMKMRSAKAVSGDSLTIATRNGGVMADNARVVKTDIVATNGVIHVIDAVMMPKDK